MTLQECKDQIARLCEFKDWKEAEQNLFDSEISPLWERVTKLYASEKVKEALLEAANNADYYICQNDDGQEPFHHESNIRIDKNSILSLETELIELINKEK